MLCMNVVKRVNPEFSPQGKIFFYFFNFVSIWDDRCSLNLKRFIMYVSHYAETILYSDTCQLYLNKTGIKNKNTFLKYFNVVYP